ncbi:MAG: quinol:cytochrome C oxidoreductase, partial [Bacteroidota bacterium]
MAEEQYIFRPETKRKIFITLAVGIILSITGIFTSMNSGHGDGHGEGGKEGHGEEHAMLETSEDMTASSVVMVAEDGGDHADAGHGHGGHHGSPVWLKRLFTNLWINNIYFVGLAIIGVFFVAIQYAAQAGWSVGMLRIPTAMASWLLIGGVLTFGLWWLVKGDVFHWTHSDLYIEGGENFDKIIDGKKGFFFWPLTDSPSLPVFYLVRMVAFFGIWWFLFKQIKKQMFAEDLEADTKYWYKARKLSTIFLVIFGFSSSVAAWDWVMSIDTHWFSTMFGWYTFASWWVTGLAFITLMVAVLKQRGYLKIVNENHIHDIGKFVFGFSIFWTYIWFSQFLLIYYANIPEETVYFDQRWHVSNYSW